MSDLHVSRAFGPDPFAPGCGCALLPCGMVSFAAANAIKCEQHSIQASRTVRASHREWDCPQPHFTDTRTL